MDHLQSPCFCHNRPSFSGLKKPLPQPQKEILKEQESDQSNNGVNRINSGVKELLVRRQTQLKSRGTQSTHAPILPGSTPAQVFRSDLGERSSIYSTRTSHRASVESRMSIEKFDSQELEEGEEDDSDDEWDVDARANVSAKLRREREALAFRHPSLKGSRLLEHGMVFLHAKMTGSSL